MAQSENLNMPPTISHLPLPQTTDETFVHIISHLLTPAECTTLITRHTPSLSSNATTHTNRLRHIFDDEELADTLWERLKQFYDSKRVEDEEGCRWTASGLNTRFRFARYDVGGVFEPHVDGRRLASVDSQSFMTVNIYLNSVLPEDGGATRILRNQSTSATGESSQISEILGKIQPIEGSASVFRDSLYHDGEAVLAGRKYLLRTDILSTRDEPFDLDKACAGLCDEEKGRKALGLAVRLEDGGNAMEAVRWYKRAFRLWPALEKDG